MFFFSGEGDHNKEGKQLTFIKHHAKLLLLLYTMYSVSSVFSDALCQGNTADVLGATCSGKEYHSKEDNQLNLPNTRTTVCSVIATVICHHSCSPPRCQLTFMFSSGSANQFRYQPALKPVDQLQNWQPASKPVRLLIGL